MIPIFSAFENQFKNDPLVNIIQNISCNIFAFHEMGHHFFNDTDKHWNTEISNELRKIFESVIDSEEKNVSSKDLLEIKCDFLGLISCFELSNFDGSLNILILSYYIMSTLYSLKLSADKTITEITENYPAEHVDFSNIGKQTGEYGYCIQVDHSLYRRAELMVKMCKKIAEQKGIEIFTKSKSFPVSNEINSLLHWVMNDIMIMKDSNERAISRLLAEAFHNHEEGMNYLYLRSKVFKSNRDEIIL